MKHISTETATPESLLETIFGLKHFKNTFGGISLGFHKN
jgi:hypothetical protein